MSFPFDISPNLEKVLDKLGQRDRNLAIAVRKKMEQITSCDEIAIQHFKNLRHDLSTLKRIRIGSFILVFRIKENTVIFEDFDHHDRIYKKRFKF